MRGPRRTATLAIVLVALVAVAPLAPLPFGLDGGPVDPTAGTEDGPRPGPGAGVTAPVRAATAAPAPVPAAVPARAGQGQAGGVERSAGRSRPVVPEPNTTSFLALSGDDRTSRIATVTLDAGAAVAADGGGTRSAYRTSHLRRAFAAAEGNRTAQRAVLRRAADRLDARITALERRERAALERYNAGEASTRGYLRELVAIDATADALDDTTALLSRYSNAVGTPVASARIASFKARLLPLKGPVRDRARLAMTGETNPTRVYVETTGDGVVLATIERGPFVQQYVREATISDARQPNGTDRFAATGDRFTAARDRFEELYPWAAENQGGLDIGTFGGEPFLHLDGVYSVSIDHPHGTSRTGDLVTFLDGSTRDAFHERQYKDLTAVPTDPAATNTTRNLTLRVERTRSGGPLLVRTVNASTGAPVIASVSVDGERVGKTGVDGRRWLVAPRTSTRVAVTRGNTTVSAFVFTDGPPSGT